MSLFDLPVLITTAGTYKTRRGDTARILTTGGFGHFSARGTVQKGKRAEPNAWHPTGRVLLIGEHPDDIVGRIGS
jgi:hypothetical protein